MIVNVIILAITASMPCDFTSILSQPKNYKLRSEKMFANQLFVFLKTFVGQQKFKINMQNMKLTNYKRLPQK